MPKASATFVIDGQFLINRGMGGSEIRTELYTYTKFKITPENGNKSL